MVIENCLVIHHDDPDGRMGGFILQKYYLEKGYKVDTFEASYGMQFDFKKMGVTPNHLVAIVDFSLNNQFMAKLKLIVPEEQIVWIDHHKSAIENYPEQSGLEGIRYIGLSGCELAYLYSQGWRQHSNLDPILWKGKDVSSHINGIDIPYGVKLIGDFDCWRKEIKESYFLIRGIDSQWDRNQLYKPTSKNFWDKILESAPDELDKLIQTGRTVNRYIDAHNSDILNKYGFEVKLRKFTDLKAIAINTDSRGSGIFNTVRDDYEVGITFTYSKNPDPVMIFSIYRLGLNPKKEIDVSVIASSFGGGGHPGASGFTTSGTLPFVD